MTYDEGRLPGGHLQYYQQHTISPVHYRVESLDTHFDRRDSLYRSLGLPPIAFRGARVLEVAPGSGQNSLYVAACRPATYDLIEPNIAGLRDIKSNYAAFNQPHTRPRIHSIRFESFNAEAAYDIVLCENWLGCLPHEVALIEKLASLVAPGGVLVLTFVPFSGFFPNIMRKLLALRIIDPAASFEAKTTQLVNVFGPHLSTIANMTRSHRDWVQDCLLNPHYLNVALPLEAILEAIGNKLEILSTAPRFTLDWRWFKKLTGRDRRFNDEVLGAYRRNLHNFIDYRKIFSPRREADNRSSDVAFRDIHRAALAWQVASEARDDVKSCMLVDEIAAQLQVLKIELAAIDTELADAIAEVTKVWVSPHIDPGSVENMRAFGALFGRETVYASFTRPR